MVFDMPCPKGTRYDVEMSECVLAAEDENCYYSNPAPPGEILTTQVVFQCLFINSQIKSN